MNKKQIVNSTRIRARNRKSVYISKLNLEKIPGEKQLSTAIRIAVALGVQKPETKKQSWIFLANLPINPGDVRACKAPSPRRVSDDFYMSKQWRDVRYRALKLSNRSCLVCGNGPKTGSVLHVDHIKPRSLFPELELDLNNLQVLCEDCNIGKSNKDEIDWR